MNGDKMIHEKVSFKERVESVLLIHVFRYHESDPLMLHDGNVRSKEVS